jgi:probable rRNA maturation factor
MVHIQISETIISDLDASLIDEEALKQAARCALVVADTQGETDLSILLTDDNQIRTLNRQFRDVDAPTDVLAFPSGEIDPDTKSLYLGDVVISYPQAGKQAGTEGHTLKTELQLLVVHGVLHLLGYDHGNSDTEERMWALQADAMAQLDGE